MFKDSLFVPERHARGAAIALPAAALSHALFLNLALVLPLLKVGDLPQIRASDVRIAPALPKTPLPPPKGRTGSPGGRIRPRTVPVAAAAWRVAPVDIPVGIAEEDFGAEGADYGIPGGVDYGVEGGLPANILSEALYSLVGEVEAPVRAVGEVRPPRLVRKIEPDYPEIARMSRVEGIVILEATTDVYGRVTDVRILRSIPLLDGVAIAAVRQWVYEPMIINGRPRPVVFTVTVRFQLK
ncbi:MAG: energy transducer TonB [Acidobacteriota bacterium]|nr:energy transducer TonB [Acidobacteriota bacterium]